MARPKAPRFGAAVARQQAGGDPIQPWARLGPSLVVGRPPFEGDATLIDGEVTDIRDDKLLAVPVATIKVTMTNQDGNVLAAGDAEIELLR